MRFLKLFKLFKNNDVQDIHQICKKYEIENYTVNDDGSIDINGDVDLSRRDLYELPLKFGNITGDFYCNYNRLVSLEGCPQSVGGDFVCSYNHLVSLEGCPQSVGRDFDCTNNQLTSMEGSPQSVDGGFYCQNNKLTSLEGCPQSIGGHFSCSRNQLQSLEGSPQSINGSFYCQNNKLTSLRVFPNSINGDFYCYGNPIYNIWMLFEDKSLIEFFNEFDCVRDNKLIIDRLNAFLDEIGKPNVKNVESYKNI